MKIQIILTPEEAGYLSKFLRQRYHKSKKVALSTLILLGAKESAAREAEVKLDELKYEEI